MSELLDEVGICLGTLLPDPMVCSADDFTRIAEAAAATGARTTSVWTLHAMTLGFDATAARLDALGLRVGAIEAAISWENGPGDAVASEAESLLVAADALGATRVAAVCVGLTADMGAAADGLALLCRLVAPGGLQVTVEFLPWSGIPTIAAAARLIDACGEPNAGVLLDTWHWTRQPGGPDVETLRSIAPERIGYMQLSDVAPVAGDSLVAETMTNRLLPGDGVVDFAGLFGVLDEMGATPFVSSEVFNTELVAQGPAIAARQMYDACVNLRGV
jgi:sugar phosphate isomerase/epimerase